MYHDQKGITFIEALLTITILSIAGILLWGVFFQGTNFSNSAITKNQIQQEANIIISELTKLHQTAQESYEINSSNCKFRVLTTSGQKEFEHSQLCYEINYTGTVYPISTNHLLPVELTIKDNNTGYSYSVTANLFRLKGSESDEETD